jgi:hypothetical protein
LVKWLKPMVQWRPSQDAIMTTRSTVPPDLIQIGALPQVVPSQVCFTCGVCCHFPEEDSFLRPYFTEEEIRQAVASGLDPSFFPNPAGAQIRVVPNPAGDGYLCPAFDPATSRCRIYRARPLDCQIYPLAVMWSAPLTPVLSPEGRGEGEGPEVALGWDTKCPFLGERPGVERRTSNVSSALSTQHSALSAELVAYAGRVAELIENNYVETYAAHPGLIGRFQDDVVIVRTLPALTERMRGAGCGVRCETRAKGEEGERSGKSEKRKTSERGEAGKASETGKPCVTRQGPGSHVAPFSPVPRVSPTINFDVRRLTFDDLTRFETACASVDTSLAAYAFAPHYIWRDLFAYSWADVDGCFCLFAEYADGVYMPLPPLPITAGERGEMSVKSGTWRGGPERDVRDERERRDTSASSVAPVSLFSPVSPVARDIISICFSYMQEKNQGSAVSRVENIPEEWAATFEQFGCRLSPKDPDYLYRTGDLVALAGDRYKAQRAACNRFERDHRFEWRAYRDEDREACLTLYRQWTGQQGQRRLSDTALHMLRDSESAHRQALEHAGRLGLEGRVVLVDGVIRAYTFGYVRGTSVFCVLLEVADRTMFGLAQWTFREFCREAAAGGFEMVNTMDASGLPELARSKEAYCPIRRIPSFIASR